MAHGSQRPSAVWYVGSMWLYFISLSQHRLRSARIVLATNLGSIVGVSVGDGAHKNACLDRRRDQALDRTRAPENECASDREAAWTPHSFRQTTRSPAGIGSAGGQTQTFSNSLTEAARDLRWTRSPSRSAPRRSSIYATALSTVTSTPARKNPRNGPTARRDRTRCDW